MDICSRYQIQLCMHTFKNFYFSKICIVYSIRWVLPHQLTPSYWLGFYNQFLRLVVIGLNLFKSYGNWIYSGKFSTHLTYLLLSIQEDFVLWTQDEPDIHWRALWKGTLSPSKMYRIYPYDDHQYQNST